MSINDGASQDNTRVLGFWSCSAFVVGNMIGSGIFLLPASLATYGSISLIGWLVTSVGALALALVFSRLARMVPRTGGPHAYTRAAFGDFAAFLVAWGYWIAIWCGNAAIVVAFLGYLSVFIPALTQQAPLAVALALLAVWSLVWVNIRGVRQAGFVQIITTVLKLLPLIALILAGLPTLNPNHFTPFNLSSYSTVESILACSALTLWAFLGLESATVPAGSVRNPQRTIPAATLFGTLFTAALYLTATVAIFGVMPPQALQQSNAPFADAAALLWGEQARLWVAAGAVISTFGALNGWMLLQGQVPLGAAQDKLFPPLFARISKHGTPYVGILVSSTLMTLLMLMSFHKGLVKQFEFIILLATLTSLVPYIFCAMAKVMLLLFRSGQRAANGLVGSILLALTAFIYSWGAILGSGKEVVYYGFALLTAGIPVYVWIYWRHRRKIPSQ